LCSSIRRRGLKSVDESIERNIREPVCGALAGRMKRTVSDWLVKSGAIYSNQLQSPLFWVRGIGWRETLLLIRGTPGRGEMIEKGGVKI
jgi:hypothetical protein